MHTVRVRNVAMLLLVALLLSSMLACDLGGGAAKPTIVITAPTSNAQFEDGEEVNVLSSANDSKGITRVELLVDGELYRTDSSPSAEGEKSLAMAQTWTATDPGMHTLSVIAYNVGGQASEPWAVTIEVVGGGGVVTPPTATSQGAPPAATNTPPPPPPEATATTPPPPQETPEPELQPDLYISEIRIVPEEPQQGVEAEVGVRVHNGGNADSGPFKVVWRYAGDNVGCEWDVGNLAAGANQWQQCPFTYPTWSTYTTTAVVDVGGDVDESEEGNNELTLQVVVHGTAAHGPDLEIIQIVVEPQSPVLGEEAHVGVQVLNSGDEDAGAFKIVWRSGEPDGVVECTVTSLAAGADRWCQDEYTYTGHGHFNTTAEVDVETEVDEMHEDNNTASLELDVTP